MPILYYKDKETSEFKEYKPVASIPKDIKEGVAKGVSALEETDKLNDKLVSVSNAKKIVFNRIKHKETEYDVFIKENKFDDETYTLDIGAIVEPNSSKYYTNLATAISDLNSGTFANAVNTSAGAVCLVCRNSAGINAIKMLANIVVPSNITLSVPVIIDLNGKTLTFDGYYILNEALICFYGRKDGSKIIKHSNAQIPAIYIASNVYMYGVRIEDDTSTTDIGLRMFFFANNVSFDMLRLYNVSYTYNTKNPVRNFFIGINSNIQNEFTVEIIGCDIRTAFTEKVGAYSCPITIFNGMAYNYDVIVEDSTIEHLQYDYWDDQTTSVFSVGTKARMFVSNSRIRGSNNSVQMIGTSSLYVVNSVLEGSVHGGVYTLEDSTSYIKDSVIRQVKQENFSESEVNHYAAYFGEGSKVYLDNVKFESYHDNWAVPAIKGNHTEVHMSNCDMYGVRVDNDCYAFMGLGMSDNLKHYSVNGQIIDTGNECYSFVLEDENILELKNDLEQLNGRLEDLEEKPEPKDIYWCDLSTVPYNTVKAAYNDGKLPACMYSPNPSIGPVLYTLVSINDSRAIFTAINSSIMHWYTIPATGSRYFGSDLLENQARKTNTIINDGDKYPSAKAVYDFVSESNNNKLDKSALLDKGVKSISWNTVLDGSYTTVDDPLSAQRPSGTTLRHWVEISGWRGGRFIWEQTYRVTFDGTVYDNLVCKYGVIQGVPSNGEDGYNNPVEGSGEATATSTTYGMIGNRHLYDSRYYDTKEPFCIVYIEHFIGTTCPYYFAPNVGNVILLTADSATHTVKCEKASMSYSKLPHAVMENYGMLDDPFEKYSDGSSYAAMSLGYGNMVGRGNYAIGGNNIATNSGNCANTGAIGYGNKSTNGLAIGVRNTTTGNRAIALGSGNTVTGEDATAIGHFSSASGARACAIGQGCEANGEASFASGYVCKATGHLSIARGQQSEAKGYGSFAQGIGVVATSTAQHVVGMYNEEDNDMSLIIGNGESSKHSNCLTVDKTGNVWASGDITLQGDNQKSPNRHVVSEPILPEGYTRVKALISYGDRGVNDAPPYIDLGIYATENTTYDIAFEQTPNSGIVFGSYERNNQIRCILVTGCADIDGASVLFGCGGSLGYGGSFGKYEYNNAHVRVKTFIKDENNISYIAICELASAADSYQKARYENEDAKIKNRKNIYLFACNGVEALGGSVNNFNNGVCKVYYLKLHEDNELIMNLIPCLDSNFKPCMYDTVSQKPFYSSNNGRFFVEPILENII